MRLFSRRSPEARSPKILKSSGDNNDPQANTEAREHKIETRVEEDCNWKRTDIPQTKVEAQEHIANIRAEKGLDGPNNNTEDLEAALDVLSKQLYRKSTHFLLELIQNVDDNSYEASTPTMNIIYKQHTLRIDNNEIGFSRANVDSICRIGRSSKSGLGDKTRYTGEKGIGFKSVFKVSDIVWITSGQYSFKFDKNEKLGMIAPIPADFPGKSLPGFTSILLQLSQDCDVGELVREVKALDAKLLIFLRNLKEVNIEIFGDDRNILKTMLGHQNTWKTTLRRQDAVIRNDGQQFVTLRHGKRSLSYTVFRHPVLQLPHDPKREGRKQSEILLAFPSNSSSEPGVESQNVYAFLPIRDYGFKFVLQADFLLTANREDIDSSSPRNKELLDHVPHALLRAINEFNTGKLRYSWLCYLPLRSYMVDFFQDLEAKTLGLLSKQPILESLGGDLMAPSELIYVPDQFTDADSRPLIPTGIRKLNYLSPKYSSKDKDPFKRLGVTFLSAENFLDDLGVFISKSPTEFQEMPHAWHSRLSQVLASLTIDDRTRISTISAFQIVPLRDGRWIPPNAGNLLFPLTSSNLVVPKGIRVFEVHPDVEKDAHRRNLLMVLGVKESKTENICQIILQTHENHKSPPVTISAADLISHVVFLYEARFQTAAGPDLWFITENGSYCRSSQIYMDSEVPFSASKIFAENRSKFPFLHKDYWKAFSIPGDWQTWLVQNLNIAVIPRLAIPSKAPEGSFTLTDDFRLLINNCPSSNLLLLLLRHHWKDYSQWIVTDNSGKDKTSKKKTAWEKSQDELRGRLSSMNVRCRGGVIAQLGQTFLPRSSILLENVIYIPESRGELLATEGKLYGKWENSNPASGLWGILSSMKARTLSRSIAQKDQTPLPASSMLLENPSSVRFLDVPEPDHQHWDYLKHFGVVVKLEVGSFINRLRGLKSCQTSIEQVSRLYDQIQACAHDSDAHLIRCSFQEHKLVFIPTENTERIEKWTNIDACVWNGPDCLKSIPCLEGYYPTHHSLFCDILGLRSADIKTLVAEAQQIMPNDNLEYIRQVFITTSQFLETPRSKTTDTNIMSLARCQIFPIQTGMSLSNFDYLSAALDANEWYIADRSHLRQSFQGRLHLLAFDQKTLEKMGSLIQKLGLEQRLLSTAAKGVTMTEGKVKFRNEYTASLRAKAKYIARLVPNTKSDRDTILEQLRCIQVYQSEKLAVIWTVKLRDSSIIDGRKESGRVKLTAEAQTLKIFLAVEELEVAPPPLELTEELSQFCGIVEPERVAILSHILMQTDLKRIEHDLGRRGISDDIPGFDSFMIKDSEEKADATNIISQNGLEPPECDANVATFWANNQLQFTSVSGFLEESLLTCPTCMAKVGHTKDRDGKPQQESKFHFQPLTTPVYDSGSSSASQVLNGDSEKTNDLRNTIAERRYKQEIAELLSRIETLESQLAASVLPQGTRKLEDLVYSRNGNPNYHDTVRSNPGTELEGNGKFRKTLKSPAISVAMRNGMGLLPMSMDTLDGIDDEETKFIGEIYVSKLLEKHLGGAYLPNVHWTSGLRSRAGHIPYKSCDQSTSTFTIPDNHGELTNFLAQRGYREAESLGEGPIYHMEVCTSEGKLHSKFQFDSGQAHKALSLTMAGNTDTWPREVFVLIRVYNVYTDLGIAFFVDPWQLHIAGLLYLETYSKYQAWFKEGAPAVFLREPTDTNHEAEKGLLYTYRQLKNPREIRLLELSPGKDDMPLEGAIRHVSIDSQEPFWAISYVWGATPTSLAPFYFKTPNGGIPITSSLHSALRCIRERGVSTLLWADAVCINQEDSLEKSIQIRLLRTIYQASERVIAWIGNEADNSHRAIETLEQIRFRSQTSESDSWPDDLPCIPATWAGKEVPSWNDGIWDDIGMLLERSWFKRIWIVQELVLPSKVVIVCGRSELDWDHFFEALTICENGLNPEDRPDPHNIRILNSAGPAYALGQTRRRFKDDCRWYSLLELLELFAHTKATLERDKLFALLGLASDAAEEAFNPDYDSPMEDIIRRYAGELVQRGQVMDLLYRGGISKSYPFCSWIPFWTRENFPRTISTWAAAGGSFYAGRGTPPKASLGHDGPSTLVINGFSIDFIVSISNTRISNRNSFIDDIRASIGYLKDYPTGENHEELMLKLPIGNAKGPHLESPNNRLLSHGTLTEAEDADWPPNLQSELSTTSHDMLHFLDRPPHTRETVSQYWHTAAAFATRIPNRTFCVTGRGYAGLVPGDAAVGDEICVFHGGAVPFVMRKGVGMDKIGGSYSLVGECYVHGVMYGEALEFEGIRESVFRIM